MGTDEMSEIQTAKKDFNYGLAFLRVLMCFEVVLCHFWTNADDVSMLLKPFAKLRGLAVPVFMFLSFFLTEKTFLEDDKVKAKRRIWRVVYPQIGWALIYWIGITIGQIKINFGVSFTDLLWQMVTGHSPRLNASMWFQTVLIVLTVMYIFIFRFFEVKKGILITYILLFIALVLQYSGINFRLFDSLRYELRYPLGRFCEMIPYATLGFLCAYYNIFEKMKEKRLFSIIMCGLASLFLVKYTLIKSASGFGYSNNNCILLSFFMIGFAYLIPFECLSENIRICAKFLTKYTLGIYCMHRLVAEFLKRLFPKVIGIEIDSFILCITTYLVGFVVSFLLCRIPSKYFRQLVD